MATLNEIETRAKTHALAREKLGEIVSALHEGIEALKRTQMPRLKAAVNRAAESEAALRALIEESPELFEKPRTVVFHGIKLGYQKAKGVIEWDDPDRVVQLIKRHFPDLADELIATSEKPARAALNNLSAADLKKLGITVTGDTDAVLIKPADSEVDKVVNALLKGAAEEVAA